MLNKLFNFLKNTEENKKYIYNYSEKEKQENSAIAVEKVLDHFIKLVKVEFCDSEILEKQKSSHAPSQQLLKIDLPTALEISNAKISETFHLDLEKEFVADSTDQAREQLDLVC